MYTATQPKVWSKIILSMILLIVALTVGSKVMASSFNIDVRLDIKQVTKHLDNISKKQVPFATALALTKTAIVVKKELEKQLPKKIDRPTAFTQRAFAFKKATKRNLTATVLIKPIQYEYLRYQIEGGTRIQKGSRRLAVPGRTTKRNKFGNVPGRRKGLASKKTQFVGTIKGVEGVWQRVGTRRNKGVRLVYAFKQQVRYNKRFPFYVIAEKTVGSVFLKEFNKAMARAIATAR